MRSRDADRFNHDPWADGYDEKVRDETNPIRAGYAALLAWTVEQAHITPASVVLDLGVGTGNTAALIPSARKVVGVDVSARMLAQAPEQARASGRRGAGARPTCSSCSTATCRCSTRW